MSEPESLKESDLGKNITPLNFFFFLEGGDIDEGNYNVTDMCKVKGNQTQRRRNESIQLRATEIDGFSLRSSIAWPRVIRFTGMYRSHCNSSYVSTESHSSWGQSALVSRTGVLVGSDGNQLQDPLSSCPVHPPRSKINQDQVVVCSAWQEGGGWGAGGEPDSCTAFVEMLLLPDSH